MKNILFYISLGSLPVGLFLRTRFIDLGHIVLLLGLLYLLLYSSYKAIKELIVRRDGLRNLLMYVMLTLMTITIYANYFYKSFWDYPSLLLVPLFFVFSWIYFKKPESTNKSLKTKAAVSVYLFFTLPIFLFMFGGPLGEYVPRWWLQRYSFDQAVRVSLPYGYQLEETEQLSIKAFDLKKAGKYDSAISTYKQALELEPENPSLYFDLSECYAYSNELELAVLALDTAIELDPNFAVFYGNRGLLHHKLHKNDKAIIDLNKAIELSPSESVYYANLALALHNDNRTAEACDCIRKAEQFNQGILKDNSVGRLKNYCHQQNL